MLTNQPRAKHYLTQGFYDLIRKNLKPYIKKHETLEGVYNICCPICKNELIYTGDLRGLDDNYAFIEINYDLLPHDKDCFWEPEKRKLVIHGVSPKR